MGFRFRCKLNENNNYKNYEGVLQSCSNIWELLSLRGRNLLPTRRYCAQLQSSPAKKKLSSNWKLLELTKARPIMRLIIHFPCMIHLLSLTPLDWLDGGSLPRPWFRRGGICSKASHDARYLTTGLTMELRCLLIKIHLWQCESSIYSHPEVEKDGHHVEDFIKHSMLWMPFSIFSIGHGEQVAWEINNN